MVKILVRIGCCAGLAFVLSACHKDRPETSSGVMPLNSNTATSAQANPGQPPESSTPPPPLSASVPGKMIFVSLEAGCWLFQPASGGSRYFILNPPNELRHDGLHVKLDLPPEPQVQTSCQTGTPAE